MRQSMRPASLVARLWTQGPPLATLLALMTDRHKHSLAAPCLSLLAACGAATGRFPGTLPPGPSLQEVLAARPPADDADPRPEDVSYRVERTALIDELRARCRDVKPPVEPPRLKTQNLVEPVRLDPSLRLDVRYATNENFLGAKVYDEARVFLQAEAAVALVAGQQSLAEHGLGLLLHDGYRPWRVTKLFWEATPAAQRDFVADPANGSRHNRGCAIDLSLCDLATGAPLAMPSDFDAFTAAAHPNYQGGTRLQRWRRDLLRAAMEQQGFHVYDGEWWHFDFETWQDYPLLDVPFADLNSSK